jgi:hypothetical protein
MGMYSFTENESVARPDVWKKNLEGFEGGGI